MRTFGIVMLCLLGFCALGTLGIGCHLFGIGLNHVYKSAGDAVVDYDQYWDIYHTCEKLNTDLGIIQQTSKEDEQFKQFSKTERINAIKMNLNRWIQEYNAKSEHIDKKWWKSDKLPYQLSVNDFSNYNN